MLRAVRLHIPTVEALLQSLKISKEEASVTVKGTNIKNSSSKKLPGVLIQYKLTFNDQIFKLCKKQFKN